MAGQLIAAQLLAPGTIPLFEKLLHSTRLRGGSTADPTVEVVFLEPDSPIREQLYCRGAIVLLAFFRKQFSDSLRREIHFPWNVGVAAGLGSSGDRVEMRHIVPLRYLLRLCRVFVMILLGEDHVPMQLSTKHVPPWIARGLLYDCRSVSLDGILALSQAAQLSGDTLSPLR